MPDLGKYAFIVYASYGTTFLLLGGVIYASIRRHNALRKALEAYQNKTTSTKTREE